MTTFKVGDTVRVKDKAYIESMWLCGDGNYILFGMFDAYYNKLGVIEDIMPDANAWYNPRISDYVVCAVRFTDGGIWNFPDDCITHPKTIWDYNSFAELLNDRGNTYETTTSR